MGEPGDLVVGIAVGHLAGDLDRCGDAVDRAADLGRELCAAPCSSSPGPRSEGQGGCSLSARPRRAPDRRVGPGCEADRCAERLVRLRGVHVADADPLDPAYACPE